jgi:fatty-acyl-CoA synthase
MSSSHVANDIPLSPLSFLARTARTRPQSLAIIDGERRLTYATLKERAQRLASLVQRAGVAPGQVVSVLLPNCAEMIEAHFGVPLSGAVLNAINTRLDAATVAFILGHAEAKLILVEAEFLPLMAEATALLSAQGASCPPVLVCGDLGEGTVPPDWGLYEAALAEADPAFPWAGPSDERATITLNYTSGTTGNPKGALYSHRGTYLNAVGNTLGLGLNGQTVYLWTLPMFHCNGWSHPWAVTLSGGVHVCLRKIDPAAIFSLIAEHGVSHMCGAPVVLSMLIHAPSQDRKAFSQTVQIATGGAAPPSSVIAGMESLGFRVTHLYGLTETCGPSTLCVPEPDWFDWPLSERAVRLSRQGIGHAMVGDWDVIDQISGKPVPADGTTVGELVFRSNTMMKGYLNNPQATAEALSGGWFHSGDLAVMHDDGVVEIKDRAKDVIISGGENISSLEIEEVLYRHPKIREAAVVAMPHPHWGETPCAFVTPVDDESLSAEEVIAWCRDQMAHFKAPRAVRFGPLPKTSTGKIQKFVLRQAVSEESEDDVL